jgi:hypothetical protein
MRKQDLDRKKPLLVGMLRVVREAVRFVLVIDVWCPYCKQTHTHGWVATTWDPRQVEHRAAHCAGGSPLGGDGCWIGPDPERRDENRQTFERFRRLVEDPTPWWLRRAQEATHGADAGDTHD